MRILLLLAMLSMAASLGAAPTSVKKEAALSEIPAGPSIHVLLEKNVPSVFLEVKGAYTLYHKDSGVPLSRGKLGKRFMIHAIPEGLRWGEELPDAYQITIVPTQRDTPLYVNGIQYEGALSVYRVRDNRITVVNEVPIEAYVKSLLAVRQAAPLAKEALSALAIVTRTEAYNQLQAAKHKNRPWQVSAQEVGYYGSGVLYQSNGVEEAVEATRFMVLDQPSTGAAPLYADPQRAEELAKSGYNAKKILQTLFPRQRLGLTVPADEVAIRA